MPRKSNTIGIIGLGRFGMNVAKELASSGKSILFAIMIWGLSINRYLYSSNSLLIAT